MDWRLEQKSERLAWDLDQGNVQDAACILQNEARFHPEDTWNLINSASQRQCPTGVDYLAVGPERNIEIVNRYNGSQACAGYLPQVEICQPPPPPVVISPPCESDPVPPVVTGIGIGVLLSRIFSPHHDHRHDRDRDRDRHDYNRPARHYRR